MFKDLTIAQFFQDLGNMEPAPGGGAASASVALHGIALAQMVINFSFGNAKKQEVEDQLRQYMKDLDELHQELLMLVDVENQSFAPVLKAMALPKDTQEEMQIRQNEIDQALAIACDSPKAIMLTAKRGLDILSVLTEIGNPFLVSDTLTGIQLIHTAIETSTYNIIVNSRLMKNEFLIKEYVDFVDEFLNETNEVASIAKRKGMAILLK